MIHPKLNVVDHPLANTLMSRLRDQDTIGSEFRSLLDGLTFITLIEALRGLEIEARSLHTPLIETAGWALKQPIAFVPVLRAGLGMVGAAQMMVPEATIRHLGLFRDETTLEPVAYYNKLEVDTLENHDVFVLDPMLATAGTATAVLDALAAAGASSLHFVALLGAPEGVERLSRSHPSVPVTLTALDERLTGEGDHWPPGYILPGLGDAGDRQFQT
jgi:uracil phosphoribosyltransferase